MSSVYGAFALTVILIPLSASLVHGVQAFRLLATARLSCRSTQPRTSQPICIDIARIQRYLAYCFLLHNLQSPTIALFIEARQAREYPVKPGVTYSSAQEHWSRYDTDYHTSLHTARKTLPPPQHSAGYDGIYPPGASGLLVRFHVCIANHQP